MNAFLMFVQAASSMLAIVQAAIISPNQLITRVGSNVSLTCQLSDVNWTICWHYKSSDHDVLIHDGYIINPRLNTTRYIIETDREQHKSHLLLRDVQLTDPISYNCEHCEKSGLAIGANIVVIDFSCEDTVFTDSSTMSKVQCVMNHTGDQAPDIECLPPVLMVTPKRDNCSRTRCFSLNISHNSHNNYIVINCTVYFPGNASVWTSVTADVAMDRRMRTEPQVDWNIEHEEDSDTSLGHDHSNELVTSVIIALSIVTILVSVLAILKFTCPAAEKKAPPDVINTTTSNMTATELQTFENDLQATTVFETSVSETTIPAIGAQVQPARALRTCSPSNSTQAEAHEKSFPLIDTVDQVDINEPKYAELAVRVTPVRCREDRRHTRQRTDPLATYAEIDHRLAERYL